MKYSLTILCLFATLPLLAQKEKAPGEDVVFEKVQEEPQFPGGLTGWRNYLSANLNTALGDSCLRIPKGQTSVKQTAIITFKIDAAGKVSDVRVENPESVHPRLAAEALRVISEGPDWIPARQNGKNVVYRQKQSITWVVSED